LQKFCFKWIRPLVLTFSFLLLIFPIAPAFSAERGTSQNPVRMMFVPYGDAQVILEGGSEISKGLQKVTGLHFKTSVATSYAAVIEAMGAGKVDIGWLGPFSYVLAKKKYDIDLLLIMVRFGKTSYRGQIMVRADSGIDSLQGLKGKTFAFVDPASTSGHIYAKTLLISKGFNPETHFSRAVFLGSHNAVVLSILKGEVDGGAAFEDIRAVVAKSFPEIYKKIKVIAFTAEIPNDTVAARKDLSPAIKEKIRRGLKAMTKSKEGMDILRKSYQIGGLMDLDGYYDSVRKAGNLLGLDLGELSR